MLKELIHSLPINMFLRDENDIYLEVSDRFCEIANCSREEIIGTK
jgi:PAS domain-containing protein